MADQLMFDPKTGTQYYASEVKQSAAYYAQAYGPEYRAAAAAAQADAAAQMANGVPANQAVANALAKHNPDATIPPDLANQVLSKSTPVPTTRVDRLYRFLVYRPGASPYQFETGATYPACSRSNPAGCQPKSFADAPSMLAFAESEGSTLLVVSSADEAFNIIEGKQAIDPSKIYTWSSVAGTAPPVKGVHLDKLYRFFVQHPVDHYGNQFESGATYPACSRANPAGCQSKSFPDEASMLAYAQKEGSTLIQVSSADEAFTIIEGKEAIDPSKIYTGGSLSGWTEYLVPAAIAYIAWKILF